MCGSLTFPSMKLAACLSEHWLLLVSLSAALWTPSYHGVLSVLCLGAMLIRDWLHICQFACQKIQSTFQQAALAEVKVDQGNLQIHVGMWGPPWIQIDPVASAERQHLFCSMLPMPISQGLPSPSGQLVVSLQGRQLWFSLVLSWVFLSQTDAVGHSWRIQHFELLV